MSFLAQQSASEAPCWAKNDSYNVNKYLLMSL